MKEKQTNLWKKRVRITEKNSLCVPTYISINLSAHPPVYLSIHVTSIYPSMHLPSTHLSTCLFMYHPSTHQPLPIYLSTIHLTSTRLSVYESISNFLSIHPSTHPFMYHLSTCLSVYPSLTRQPIYPSIYQYIYLNMVLFFSSTNYLSIYSSICPPACLSVYLPIHPSVYQYVHMSISSTLSWLTKWICISE